MPHRSPPAWMAKRWTSSCDRPGGKVRIIRCASASVGGRPCVAKVNDWAPRNTVCQSSRSASEAGFNRRKISGEGFNGLRWDPPPQPGAGVGQFVEMDDGPHRLDGDRNGAFPHSSRYLFTFAASHSSPVPGRSLIGQQPFSIFTGCAAMASVQSTYSSQ